MGVHGSSPVEILSSMQWLSGSLARDPVRAADVNRLDSPVLTVRWLADDCGCIEPPPGNSRSLTGTTLSRSSARAGRRTHLSTRFSLYRPHITFQWPMCAHLLWWQTLIVLHFRIDFTARIRPHRDTQRAPCRHPERRQCGHERHLRQIDDPGTMTPFVATPRPAPPRKSAARESTTSPAAACP